MCRNKYGQIGTNIDTDCRALFQTVSNSSKMNISIKSSGRFLSETRLCQCVSLFLEDNNNFATLNILTCIIYSPPQYNRLGSMFLNSKISQLVNFGWDPFMNVAGLGKDPHSARSVRKRPCHAPVTPRQWITRCTIRRKIQPGRLKCRLTGSIELGEGIPRRGERVRSSDANRWKAESLSFSMVFVSALSSCTTSRWDPFLSKH